MTNENDTIARAANLDDVAAAIEILIDDPLVAEAARHLREMARGLREPPPVPMLLSYPMCGERHIDVGAFATKVHHTHACQGCGHVWRPAVIATSGVRFLPGFKNEPDEASSGGGAT